MALKPLDLFLKLFILEVFGRPCTFQTILEATRSI